MPAPTYIISRVADPIFAVVIGLSAAATRINREQKEKGKTGSDAIHTIRRYYLQVHMTFPRPSEAYDVLDEWGYHRLNQQPLEDTPSFMFTQSTIET